MGIRIEVRQGESLEHALRRFHHRVELSRRVRPGKLSKHHYEKPSRVARQKKRARKGNAQVCSEYGGDYAYGLPLCVAARWWLAGCYH
jgi:ribosomal protein S21